ncbi:hypothetical protein Thermo_01427 [Thermoplasmatales archaeon]|nr:hypothetical protein Thermo_01427 [Thermoplasmatales archaeon]
MKEDDRDLKSVIVAGTLAFFIPFLAFAIAFLSGSLLLLDYIHVLLGAIWTGVDVFLGLIFALVIKTLDADTKRNVAMRVIPMSLFFIPATSVVTPAAGYVLAVKEGIFIISSPVIEAILIVGGFLVAIGFVTIVLFSWLLLRELRMKDADSKKITLYLSVISRGALAQLVFQIGIISLMAYLVVYV